MRYWPSLFSQDGLIWPRSFLRFYWPRRNYYMATKRIFSCGTNAGYPKWVRWARVANQSVGFASSYPLADSAIHYQAIIGWSRVWCEELCGSSRVLTTEAIIPSEIGLIDHIIRKPNPITVLLLLIQNISNQVNKTCLPQSMQRFRLHNRLPVFRQFQVMKGCLS